MKRKSPKALGQEGGRGGRKDEWMRACGAKCATTAGKQQGRAGTKKKFANAESGQPAHAIVRKLAKKWANGNCSHGHGGAI